MINSLSKVGKNIQQIKDGIDPYKKQFFRGAAIGMILSALFLLVLTGYTTFCIGEFPVYYFLLFLCGGILAWSIIEVTVRYLIFLIRRKKYIFISTGIATAFLVYFLPYHFFSIPFICFELICGGSMGVVLKRKTTTSLVLTAFIFFLFQCSLIYCLMYYEKDNSTKVAEDYRTQQFYETSFENPSDAGPYKVNSIFYGSGNDKNRPEFRDSITLKTEPVDATPFFSKTTGFGATLRRHFWGFDAGNYPLNGRVWYPLGEGSFPLVLIVHGNHNMADYSDPGYEYLGKLLAGRGYIVVSVDENFLNKGFLGDYYNREIFVRSWLILKHLEYWREWNREDRNLFSGKVDMDNIALVGHSRGGNAVGLAAVINHHKKYHDNSDYTFDFKFSIKGIVQLAPTDTYEFSPGVPVEIENIDLLVLHGSMDQDVALFLGSRFYNRMKYTDDSYHFKSLLYINNVNHSQFNTVWGKKDAIPPLSWLMNSRSVIEADKQRKIAEIYVSAFLDASLKGKKEYLSLLRDYRQGLKYLPGEYYINQFEDTSFYYIASFEEDTDLTTASVEEFTISAENFVTWEEAMVVLKDSQSTSQHNSAVFLEWKNEDRQDSSRFAQYSLYKDLSGSGKAEERDFNHFFFFICNDAEDMDNIDFTIELVFADRRKVQKAFSSYYVLPPLLKKELTKWNPIFSLGKDAHERVLQYIELPLSDFSEKNHSFSYETLQEINFIFDRAPTGRIILDRIGFN